VASLFVVIGSGLGGLARYWLTLAVARAWGEAFPWGTLLINVLGSFVIGLFFTFTAADGPWPASTNARLLVMTGICGGFTTFSAFSLQSLQLLRDGQWLPALAYMAGSVVLCLAAVALGYWLGLRLGLTPAAGA
jgi:CrcB protein